MKIASGGVGALLLAGALWTCGSATPATGGPEASVRPTSDAREAGRYELRGRRVALYNLTGSLTVRGGDVDAVTVEVERGGSDAGRLEVVTGPVGRLDRYDTSLRVIYPGDRIRYGDRGSRTHLRVREDGTFGGDGGRRVRISGRGEGLEAHADLTVTVPAGRSLSLNLGVGNVEVSNVEGELSVDTHSGEVRARGTSGELDVDTGSGSVRVTDARGSVGIDTGSGRVTVQGFDGEDLSVDTGSGRVEASDVRARDVNVDTGSGAIELSRISARELLTDTGSGSIRLDLTSDVESLEADTGSGSVTLGVPDDFGAVVRIESGSGGYQIDLPMQIRRSEASEVSGQIGDGQGRVRIDTGSGSVRVTRRGG